MVPIQIQIIIFLSFLFTFFLTFYCFSQFSFCACNSATPSSAPRKYRRTMDRLWRSSAPRLPYYSVCSTSPPSPSSSLLRHFSAAGNLAFANDSKEPWWKESVERLRNIWISGLIDPNKMELTERVLFYGGRMHELRRRDEVPQIIDWMGLGKTIHSAATYCIWKDYQVGNISKLSFKFN